MGSSVEDAMFKPWLVATVVSILQLLLGIVVYLWFGNIAIAAATVGFVTLCYIFLLIGKVIPAYCEMMEQIMGAAALIAFMVACSAAAVYAFRNADSYAGSDFSQA